MAVVILVASFAVPAVSSIMRAEGVTRGGSTVEQTMARARQLALSRNRKMEVRIYKYNDPKIVGEEATFRALQIFQVEDDGTAEAVSKVQSLPSSAAVNESSTLSPLISGGDTNLSSKPKIPRVGTSYDAVFVTFLPDGAAELGASQNYLTIHDGNVPVDASTTPDNYYTVQIDPLLGTVRSYRP